MNKSTQIFLTPCFSSRAKGQSLEAHTHHLLRHVLIWNTFLRVCILLRPRVGAWDTLETHEENRKRRSRCKVTPQQVEQLATGEKTTIRKGKGGGKKAPKEAKLQPYLRASCPQWGTSGSGSTGSASSGSCQSGSSGSLYMCSACCSGRCAWRSPAERSN